MLQIRDRLQRAFTIFGKVARMSAQPDLTVTQARHPKVTLRRLRPARENH